MSGTLVCPGFPECECPRRTNAPPAESLYLIYPPVSRKLKGSILTKGTTMPNESHAQDVLNKEFLEIRARILELAAKLDRLDRAGGSVASDHRTQMIGEGLDVLQGEGPGRAERVQLIFSIPYESNWREKMSVGKRF